MSDEVPRALRYQTCQFARPGKAFRQRSYRSGLRVETPRTVEDCHRLIPELARQMYRPNGSVDVEDLAQLGELALLEGLRNMQRRCIRPRMAALKALLESIQSAMFHAIDERQVSLPTRRVPDGEAGEVEEPILETVLGAECNTTAFRNEGHWEFIPTCCQSWGDPLPPGSCQPRPTPHCSSPRHLPIVEDSHILEDHCREYAASVEW